MTDGSSEKTVLLERQALRRKIGEEKYFEEEGGEWEIHGDSLRYMVRVIQIF